MSKLTQATKSTRFVCVTRFLLSVWSVILGPGSVFFPRIPWPRGPRFGFLGARVEISLVWVFTAFKVSGGPREFSRVPPACFWAPIFTHPVVVSLIFFSWRTLGGFLLPQGGFPGGGPKWGCPTPAPPTRGVRYRPRV